MSIWFTNYSNIAKVEEDLDKKMRTHLSIPELDREFESKAAGIVLPMRLVNGVLIGSWTVTRQSLMN